MDINLYVVIPISLIVLIYWVGGFLFMFLNIMRSDPREIEFRKNSNQSMGIIPRQLKKVSKTGDKK